MLVLHTQPRLQGVVLRVGCYLFLSDAAVSQILPTLVGIERSVRYAFAVRTVQGKCVYGAIIVLVPG